MSWTIICDARHGYHLGVRVLGLVDQSKSTEFFWTSDSPSILKVFSSPEKARKAVKKFKYNNPRVVLTSSAEAILNEQWLDIAAAEEMKKLRELEAEMDGGVDWEEDKAYPRMFK